MEIEVENNDGTSRGVTYKLKTPFTLRGDPIAIRTIAERMIEFVEDTDGFSRIHGILRGSQEEQDALERQRRITHEDYILAEAEKIRGRRQTEAIEAATKAASVG